MRPRPSGSMLRRMKRIVIATDGSAGAREALETGLSLARKSGAVATLVYVRSVSSELAQARAVLGEAAALANRQAWSSRRRSSRGVPQGAWRRSPGCATPT